MDSDPESVDEPWRRVSDAAEEDEADVRLNEERAAVALLEDWIVRVMLHGAYVARESVNISVSNASIEEVVLALDPEETDADVVCVVSAKTR